jgi:branched-chain amino acid transport system permease protein
VSTFLTFTVLGIVSGAVYAITATGLVVTYTTTGVFNFAHGAVAMFCAFSYWQLNQAWGWPSWICLIIVLLLEAPLLAVYVEEVYMKKIFGASVVRSLMISLGMMLVLVGGAEALWGPATRYLPEYFSGHSVTLFQVNITIHQIIIVAVAVLVAIGLRLMLTQLRAGIAMRAVVDDPELLSISGVAPRNMARLGWIIGFFLAALAGILISPDLSSSGLDINLLTLIVINGYAAAIVGRLKNLPWTFAGGLILGLTENYAIGYLPGHIPANLVNQIGLLFPVVFLFVALLLLPSARLRAVGRLNVATPPKVPGLAQSIRVSVVFIAIVVLASFVLGGVLMGSVTQGIALGVVGLSLVLLTGYAGQVSLCQLTFMGIGAFVMSKVADGGASWWGLILGVIICAAIGALIALPALRLQGLYLALATLAFAQAAYYGFFSNISFIPDGGAINVGRLSLPGISLRSNRSYLIFTAVVFCICAIGVLAIRRSSWGRRLVALNDSPAAFATLGMDPTISKLLVFAAAAALAGIGGVLFSGESLALSASDVQLFASLELVLFVTIFGIRTTSGALLGGLASALLPLAASHLPWWGVGITGIIAGLGIGQMANQPDGLVPIPWFNKHLRIPFLATPIEPSASNEQAKELSDVAH